MHEQSSAPTPFPNWGRMPEFMGLGGNEKAKHFG